MELEVSMIDSFIKIIDRIIKLVETKEKNKALLFDKVIQPLFTEFENVSSQYFNLLSKSISLVEEAPPVVIVHILKVQRMEYIQARTKVVTMSVSIQNNFPDIELNNFCNEIQRFFYGENCNETVEKLMSTLPDDIAEAGYDAGLMILEVDSVAQQFIKNLDKIYTTSSKDLVLDYINSELKRMESAWQSVVSKYETLKYTHVIPKNIMANK